MATEITIAPTTNLSLTIPLSSPRKPPSDSTSIVANKTGFQGQMMALIGDATREQRPLSTRWMSDELIAYTQRVWSTYLGQPVTETEAVEMLTNVRNVMLAILATDEKNGEKP